MWIEQPKKVVDKKAILALMGGIFVIAAIIVFSILVQRWYLFERQNEFDQMVPNNAEFYIHFDLSRKQKERLDQTQLLDRWQRLAINVEESAETFMPPELDLDRLIGLLGNEAAVFQLPEGRGILLHVNSESETHDYLSQAFGAESKQENIEGTVVKTQLPSNISWANSKNDIFIIADSPEAIRQILLTEKEKVTPLGEDIKAYQPATHFLYGLIRTNEFDLANPLISWLGLGIASSGQSDTYFDLDISGNTLAGKVSNHPTSLMEILRSGDASNTYRHSDPFVPQQSQMSWLNVNLKDFFESLQDSVEQSEDSSAVFSWPVFFAREIGFDWEENLLPVMDVAADITIARTDLEAETGRSFLITIQPNGPDQLEETGNNFEAVIRKIVGTLFPRGIEKVLTDGTKVTELVPDPQAGDTVQYNYDGRVLEKLWQITLSDPDLNIVYGQLDDRVVISNSTKLVDSVIAKMNSSEASDTGCIDQIKGEELLVVDEAFLSDYHPLGRNISRLFIGDGGQGKKTLLHYCIEIK